MEDTRTGKSTSYAYHPATGRLLSVTDGLNHSTSYGYYESGPNIGRKAWEQDALNHRTYYDYDTQGHVLHQWGTAGYPLAYAYNAFGQMTEMRTYQQDGVWDGDSLPAAFTTASASLTKWIYDSASGVLLAKEDAAAKQTTYTYDADGQVHTRTWARSTTGGQPITTTYAYDGARRLGSVTHSDGTPGATFLYDRLGRPTDITDAAGYHTFVYDKVGGQLGSESISGGLLGGTALSYGYDANARMSTSEVAWQDGIAASTGYQYDDLGRLSVVTGQGLSHTYDYVPDTRLLQTVTSRVGAQDRLVGTRTYDDLGRLDTITWSTSANGPVISGHDYELDDLGRRVRADREDGTHWSYGHNDRGEVTSGSRQTAQNQPLPGWSFGYNYDAIGNRNTATEARTTSGQILRTYVPNALNQYDTISVNPRLLNVRGRASASANVTVNTGTEADPNFLPVQRSGGLFAAEAVVNNANTPDFLRVWIEASQEGAGKDGQNLRTKRSGGIYVPPATSQLSYDLDGNLTDDPRWHYTWDAENRLTSMETQATAAAAGVPRQRLEFAYDSRSRRIAKRVLSARSDGILPSSVTWTLDHETRFLWDGWRLMAEVESKSAAVPFAVVRNYKVPVP